MELTLGVLFALSYVKLGLTLPLVALLGALGVLLFIVVYDLRHTIVPLTASFLLFLFSLAYTLLSSFGIHALGLTLMTAGAIGLGFLLLHVCSGGRAMGLGDAPVAFSLSLLASPYALPGLLFSFWIGALCGIAILVLRRGGPKMGIEVPFVPFLALGFLLAYFTGWNPLFSALAL
jgi:leader peptidase (prepilin peptidase)/N-methyltransferase